jgi:hypothetical protein
VHGPELVPKHAGVTFQWHYDLKQMDKRFFHVWYSVDNCFTGVRHEYSKLSKPFITTTHQLATNQLVSDGSAICNIIRAYGESEGVFFIGRDGALRRFLRIDPDNTSPFSYKWLPEERVTDPGVASIIGGGAVNFASGNGIGIYELL